MAPAWRSTRTDVNAGLKNGARGMSDDRQGAAAGKLLVALQISLCMLLLVSGGLFLRTLLNLNALNPGFDRKGLLLFALEPPPKRYPAPKNVEILHRIEEKIHKFPASVPSRYPVKLCWRKAGRTAASFPLACKLRQDKSGAASASIGWGSKFFATMGIPILEGRGFHARDTMSSPMVAVINATLARQEFGMQNPIGALFRMRDGGDPIEIVGVCADAKYGWLRDQSPATFYVLYTQNKDAGGSMTFEVRTNGDPWRFVEAIRNAVASADNDLPLIDVRTQESKLQPP